MPADIAGSNWLAVGDKRTKDAMDTRQGPDPGGASLRDADREEPAKSTLAIWDTERAVLGVHEMGGSLENLFQDPIEVEVPGDSQGRLVQGRQPACALR